jgi:hypothetical protein
MTYQLNVLRRESPKRVAVGNIDRLLFVGLYRFSCAYAKTYKCRKYCGFSALSSQHIGR